MEETNNGSSLQTETPVSSADTAPELAIIQKKDESWWLRAGGQTSSVAWAGAVFLGALSIHLANELTAARLTLPIAIMVGYAWIGYRDGRMEKSISLRATRLGQLADSLYFMGFLWTLWALIDSFIFRGLSKNETVFRAFGYALVTTATGMFVRLLLLQFMFWSDDQQDMAQRDIDQQLNTFVKSVNQVTASVSKLKATLDDLSNTQAASMSAATDAMAAAVESRLKGLETAISEVVSGIQTHGKKLTDDVGTLNNHVNDLNTAVGTAVTTTGAARRSITDSASKVSADAARAEQSARYVATVEQDFSELTSNVDHLSRETTSLGEGMSNLNTRVMTVVVTQQNMSASVSQASADAARAADSARSAASVKQDVITLTESIAGLNAKVTTTVRAQENISASVSQAAADAARAAENARSAASVKQDVVRLRAEVERLSQDLRMKSQSADDVVSPSYSRAPKLSWFRRLLSRLW